MSVDILIIPKQRYNESYEKFN